MMFDPSPFPRSNALPPDGLSPAERRAELYGLLALGLVRLKQRERGAVSRDTGEICLHDPADRSGYAAPTHEETA